MRFSNLNVLCDRVFRGGRIFFSSRTAAARTAAVLLFAGVGALAACGEKSAGRRAYLSAGCVRCHGTDAAGTGQGPTLQNLSANWDEASLARFLANPDSVQRQDPRLNALARRYSMPMPRLAMPDSVRLRIAAYLLGSQ